MPSLYMRETIGKNNSLPVQVTIYLRDYPEVARILYNEKKKSGKSYAKIIAERLREMFSEENK